MCLSSLLAPPSRCLSSNRYVECLYVRSQCSCHVCTWLVFPTAICDINLQHFHLSHQAQTVQQVQHVYPAQVQYVEENSGVYTNGNMWVNLLLSSALNTTWQILARSPSRLLFLLLSLFTPSFMSQAHGVGGSAFIFVCVHVWFSLLILISVQSFIQFHWVTWTWWEVGSSFMRWHNASPGSAQRYYVPLTSPSWTHTLTSVYQQTDMVCVSWKHIRTTTSVQKYKYLKRLDGTQLVSAYLWIIQYVLYKCFHVSSIDFFHNWAIIIRYRNKFIIRKFLNGTSYFKAGITSFNQFNQLFASFMSWAHPL